MPIYGCKGAPGKERVIARRILLGVSLTLLLSCAALSAETVTLPAAASIVGGAPFFSDARAFNTSYTASLEVTARYRCFIPSPCTAVLTPVFQFTLGPRESRAFDDIVDETFGAPDTAGGVEFDHAGSAGQLVVTSRLFSTAPTPTVGMFIPGLDNSEAHTVTVLTSIRNRGPDAGFRTNVGVFNPEDAAVTVTFSIFDANGAAVGVPVTRPLGGHSGLQVSRIFDVAGAPDFVTDNAVIVVSATGEVFSYAAVIDNATTDPIFVVGAQDQPPQPITPGASATPTNTPPGPTATRTPSQPGPTATRTPTPTAPTPTLTLTPPVATATPTPPAPTPTFTPTPGAPTIVNLVVRQFEWEFNGAGSSFQMVVGHSYEVHITNTDPPGEDEHGFSGIPALGMSGAVLDPGDTVIRMVSPTSTGLHPFSCSEDGCGDQDEHDNMLGVIQVVP